MLKVKRTQMVILCNREPLSKAYSNKNIVRSRTLVYILMIIEDPILEFFCSVADKIEKQLEKCKTFFQ